MVTAVLAALASFLLLSAEARAQCLSPNDDPSPNDIEDAKKHMGAGVAFMQDPEGARYEEAYPEFKQAYQLSGSLNALQNLAICAEKLELDGEAVECFKRFLDKKGADINPDDKTQVENDLRALQAAVAWVTFSSDQSGVQVVDVRTPRRGAPIRNTYTISSGPLRIGMHPGDHKIVASKKSQKDIEWQVDIKGGDKLSKEFTFESGKPVTAEGFKPEDNGDKPPVKPVEHNDEGPSRPMPGYAWALVGVTGALAIGWGITGGLALAKGSQYKKDNTAEALQANPNLDLTGEQKSVKTLNTVADVMMGLTIASAVTTVVLIVTRPTVDKKEEKKSDEARRRAPRFGRDFVVAPWATPGADGAGKSAGVALTASF